jgi:hypothetical protein
MLHVHTEERPRRGESPPGLKAQGRARNVLFATCISCCCADASTSKSLHAARVQGCNPNPALDLKVGNHTTQTMRFNTTHAIATSNMTTAVLPLLSLCCTPTRRLMHTTPQKTSSSAIGQTYTAQRQAPVSRTVNQQQVALLC